MPAWRLKLLYDGECPFCQREVQWLKRHDRAGQLVVEDISEPTFDPGRYGLTREEVMGVLHGILPDGRVITKLEATREAYRVVGKGWMVAPTAWPGLRWIADGLYRVFARNRVSLGRILGRSCGSRGTCRVERPKGTTKSQAQGS